MGRIAGAFVEIRPESIGFGAEAKREIARALSSVRADVPLTADGRGLREEVRRAAATASRSAVVTAGLELAGRAGASLRAAARQAAGSARADIPVGADATGLRGEIGRAASAAVAGVEADIPITAEGRGLRGEISRAVAAAGAGQSVKVGVSVDDRKLKSLLASATGGAIGFAGALKFLVLPPALFSGISLAASGLVALTGAALAAVAPLSQLAGLIPALAVGGIAVAAGFGVVAGALSGVGGALKAYSAEQKEAGAAAAGGGRSALAAARQHEAAAQAVEDATDRLAQAQESQRRDAERSAEAVEEAAQQVAAAQEDQAESAERSAERIAEANDRLQDAQDAAGESAERAAERVRAAAARMESAERALIQTQEDARDSVRALADARRDAAEELQDQALAVEDAALSEERARLNVERARERQRELSRDSKATALDRRDAALDVREAELRLKQVIESRQDDEAKLNDLRQKGVDGADGVVAAERRVTDAREAEVEAHRAVAEAAKEHGQAQRDAARDAVEAQEAVTEAARELGLAQRDAARDAVDSHRAVEAAVLSLSRTQRDADRSAQDARKSVADASRDLERALRRVSEVAEEAGSSGAASIDKFAQAMEGLSPAGQSFVRALLGVKDNLIGLRNTAAEGLFPGLEAGLRNVTPLLDSLHPTVDRIGRVVGRLGEELGALLAGPESLAGFATLGAGAASILERMGDAALILIPPMGQLLVHAIPLATVLADMAVQGSKVFAAFIDGKAKTGELQQMFRNTEATLRTLGSITFNIGGSLRGMFQAAMPTGREYLGLLDTATGKLRDLIRSDAGQSGLRRFFDESKPLVLELSGLFGDLVRGLGGIGARLAPQLAPVIAQIRSELVPALLSLVDSIDADFLSTLVSLTAQAAGLAEAFFAPTETLKLMLTVLGGMAETARVVLTELGPVSWVIRELATAATLAGTAVAGWTIARKLSELIGMRGGIDGISTALGKGGLTGMLAGLGLAGLAVGAIKGAIDALAPSIDKMVQSVVSSGNPLKTFQDGVNHLANPGVWDRVLLGLKKFVDFGSRDGLSFAHAFETAMKGFGSTSKVTEQSFRELADSSAASAQMVINGLKAQGVDTKLYEGILSDLIRTKAAHGLAEDEVRGKVDEATRSLRGTNEELDRHRDKLRTAIDHALEMSNAVIGTEAAEDRLSQALVESAGSFDLNTAKGRDAQSALNDFIGSIGREIEAGGISIERKRDLIAHLEFLANSGYPGAKEAAGRLRDELALVQATYTANVEVDAEQAHRALEAIREDIRRTGALAADFGVPARFQAGPSGRSAGGPVLKDIMYLVGEQRPELFQPDGGGPASVIGAKGPTFFVPPVSGRVIPRLPASVTANAGPGLRSALGGALASHESALVGQLRNMTGTVAGSSQVQAATAGLDVPDRSATVAHIGGGGGGTSVDIDYDLLAAAVVRAQDDRPLVVEVHSKIDGTIEMDAEKVGKLTTKHVNRETLKQRKAKRRPL